MSRLFALCAGALMSLAVAHANAEITVDFAGESATPDAAYAARWIESQGDNHAMPFAIVDKRAAKLFVFSGTGRLVGAAPALLGLAPGDDSVPGIGDKPLSQIKPEERTTPAGRYASEPGRNLTGEDIVWVDYDAAFAIHRLRPAPAHEQRRARLASDNAADHRISFGCVVVDPDFYDTVVRPTLGKHRGVVYVLPETRSVQAMLGALVPMMARQ